ncbi:MAG: YciI family protein [Archangium sp.]
MRFIVMHKFGEVERPEPNVDPKIVEGMGKLVGESMKTGVFENGAGLNPNFPRTRFVSRGGAVTREAPPIRGRNELLAGFAMVDVANEAEAHAVAQRYLKVVGDAEVEVGRVTEPWDIGVVPKPTGPVREKYLMLHSADARSEAGTPPSEKEQREMGEFMASLSTTLMTAEGVLPSKNGRRLKLKDGKATVTDGPFTETKELIGGFSILNLPSLDAATEWTRRYADILGPTIEVDILQLHERPAKG